MSDNQDSATAKAIADIQEKMLEFHKELQDLKKGRATSVAINPLLPGTSQPPVAPDDSGNSDNRSGGVQRKRGRETEEMTLMMTLPRLMLIRSNCPRPEKLF